MTFDRVQTGIGALDRTNATLASVAGVAAVAGALVATGYTPEFVVASVAAGVFALLPDALVASGIGTLGDVAKPLLLLGSGLLVVGLDAAVTYVLLARTGEAETGSRTLGTFVALGALTFLLSGSVVGAVGAGVGAALAVLAGGDFAGPAGVSRPRRRLLRATAAAGGLVGLGGVLQATAGSGSSSTPDRDAVAASLLDVAADRSLAVPGIEGLVSEEFYKVDIATADPRVDREAWTLSVTGDVDSELELTFPDLQAMPAERRFVTLRCVGDSVNGRKMDTALWTGVPVRTLLEEAGAPDSCCVTLRSADDYYVSFERADLEPGLLAYAMNGRQLPKGHGYPLRALVPGNWGETNAKWLTEIEVREEPGEGYWESRGWHGTGEVHTVAKLHAVETTPDGSVLLGGHAYAGTRGIRRVEVSTDGGDTWSEATLSEPLPGATPVEDRSDAATADGDAATPEVDPSGEALDAWRMWSYEYEAEGEHEVVVRAVDGTGTVQPKADQRPYPEGATGWVRKTVSP